MPLPKMQAAYAQSAAGLDGRGRPGTRRQPGKAVYRCANTAKCRATFRESLTENLRLLPELRDPQTAVP